MSNKRYELFYTGKLKPGLERDTVKSNLVLSLGISEVKANRLLDSGKMLLKRSESSVEAQVLAEKFDQAGLLCVVRENGGSSHGVESGSESSLVRLLKTFSPTSEGSENPSLFSRLVKGGQRRKRA